LLLIANMINLGADLGSMGEVVRMLAGGRPGFMLSVSGWPVSPRKCC
jgi:hypothetical protein